MFFILILVYKNIESGDIMVKPFKVGTECGPDLGTEN